MFLGRNIKLKQRKHYGVHKVYLASKPHQVGFSASAIPSRLFRFVSLHSCVSLISHHSSPLSLSSDFKFLSAFLVPVSIGHFLG